MDRRLPTLSDVARRAGVSYATADRVVNARGGVAEKSVLRVRAAIRDLGYVRNVAAANLSQGRLYRFAAILPNGTNAFFGRMRALFEGAARSLLTERVELTVETVEAFDPAALVRRLEKLAEDCIDGIAIVGSDADEVAEAIGALRGQGIGVVTLVSDVPGSDRDAYVGIDNVVAGRTAGRLIALAHGGQAGRILPVVGALSARDHAERLAGLRDVVAGNLSLAPEIEGRDRHDIVEAGVARALKADPEITAVYSAGAGNAGLIRVVEALPGTRPVVVLHELVPHSRRALEAGLIDIVIDQRPEEGVARVIDGLRQLADRRGPIIAEPIVPTIYVRENLPPASNDPETGKTT
ncbi:LacI family transcriptional regulator [Palleronia marisminoris]|uniref:HTH-type transcriptional regulator DegA n=1 Tax=Palleronia marisminoris TaxID=315423 RepID=A0A1Y5RL03_9RHOB|nr:LacI family DNA-binding transcriptional regulator [Palleronia marisminoris]SFG25330.1 LacI family transcriptional regulator [Palleronia marisminoris]SLN19727.1 HTH-type transcriptional regulator DegA [Palleronia marisminoris]